MVESLDHTIHYTVALSKELIKNQGIAKPLQQSLIEYTEKFLEIIKCIL